MILVSKKVANTGMELYTFATINSEGIVPATTTIDATTGEVTSTNADGVLFSGELENDGTLKQGTIADIVAIGVCPVIIKPVETIAQGDIVVPDSDGKGYAVKSNTSVGFIVERVEGNYAYVIIK